MIKKCLITLALLLSASATTCLAQSDNGININDNFNKLSINLLDPTMKVTQLAINFNITASQVDAFNEFLKATDKFKGNNVEVAYEDYKFILDNIETNDFGYVLMSGKLADYGFFYLSDRANQKTSDPNISRNHVENIETFFYPKNRLPYKEEIYLAEAYSNIMFNAQSKEVMEELLQNEEILNKYDYANYILALAAYKSNNLQIAKQYIQVATTKNPQNLNYKILEAKILANGMKPQEAMKVVKQLKKENLTESELIRRINSIEQYVLYKCATKDNVKNYHLGYYYYLEGDFNKSIRTLQNAITKKKKFNAQVNSLLSNVYLTMQEYEKAQSTAQKTLKYNKKDSVANLSLGQVNYLNQNYKKAMKNFKLAAKDDENKNKAEVKIAQTYQSLGNERKSKEMFERVLKNSATEYEAYYSIALIEPYKELTYLKKALGINIMYTNAWLALARYEISRDNFSMAEDYLAIAYYLDQNNYRYFYYQGLIYKSQDDMQTAALYFRKCLKLNPNCIEAKKELYL